jgi:hypothetical protein
MTSKEFYKWFNGLDLGHLEQHRDTIVCSALQNSADTDIAIATGDWDYVCAKNTVEIILDDPACIGI